MSPSRAHQNRQRRRLTATEVDLERRQQRALLVGTGYGTTSVEEAEASLDELVLLTETAGADPVERVLQRRSTPDPATYIGKGKAEELRQLGEALDVDLVIFDDELSPAQQRNLEKIFKVDVVDRAALILDIFAQHASSQEGMIQVELAQLRYRLPRLRGRGSAAEPARRRHRHAAWPRRDAARGRPAPAAAPRRRSSSATSTKSRRRARRSARRGAGASCSASRSSATRTPGKSTLLNRLTNAGVLVEDQLFSTLDPTTRRLHLPGGETVLLLRHGRLRAPAAAPTRRGVPVDARRGLGRRSARAPRRCVARPRPSCASTRSTRCCARSTPATCPCCSCGRRADQADRDDVKRLVAAHRGSVAVSARSGDGVEELLARDRRPAAQPRARRRVRRPYDRGDVLAALHRAR